MTHLKLEVIEEVSPSAKLASLFEQNWPAYERWYLDEGEAARPNYLECQNAIKQYMPEILPLYNELLDLFECNDLQARFLSLYNPPPFFCGCSQLISLREQPVLIRNYDFPSLLFEGVVMKSQWLNLQVIAMSDCIWGALDGINNAGLAVSLAYGGRKKVGEGFGIAIVIRYILETCSNALQAIDVLRKIPVHLDYNVALVDANSDSYTVYICPGEEVIVSQELCSTNQQPFDPANEQLFLQDSQERLRALESITHAPYTTQQSIDAFLYPPLYRPHENNQSGTLYTAAYFPHALSLCYMWPNRYLALSFENYLEQQINIELI